MGKKLTYEYVKSKFDAEGYTLLSNSYSNNSTKLNYKCPNGHTHSITWQHWVGGNRCPYCSGKVKPTIEYIKDQFEKEGYTLCSDVYVNRSIKLKCICPNGHKHAISWGKWLLGRRCIYCCRPVKLGMDFIKKSFKDAGYTLLSDKYEDAHAKLKCACPYGHVTLISWNMWKSGSRCSTCWGIKRVGEGSPNWQGGKSFEPYCPIWKDQEYKSDIRERDGNRCLNPYCYGNDNVLSIHHIDYDKKNCHPSNLITVCRSCNSRANTNRTWHKSWYKAIMYRRHGVKGVKL